MLEHLLDDDTYVPDVLMQIAGKPIDRADVHEVLDAKFDTVKFLDETGASDADSGDSTAPDTAGAVFNALMDPKASENDKKHSLQLLRTPDSVKHIVAMLTAYEWSFVDEANRIRSYVTAKLLEETKHPDARIRLRAMEMLGKITEVALFTDRVEVRKIDMSDDELEKQLRARLSNLITVDAQDVQPVDLPA